MNTTPPQKKEGLGHLTVDHNDDIDALINRANKWQNEHHSPVSYSPAATNSEPRDIYADVERITAAPAHEVKAFAKTPEQLALERVAALTFHVHQQRQERLGVGN